MHTYKQRGRWYILRCYSVMEPTLPKWF